MKHLILTIIGIFFLAFKVINLTEISNEGIIQSKNVLAVFVSEDKIDTLNNISKKATAYKKSLEKKAIKTKEDKKLERGFNFIRIF